MSEVRDLRLDHLEEDVREIKTILGRLEPLITHIAWKLTSELPRFATMAALNDARGEIYKFGGVVSPQRVVGDRAALIDCKGDGAALIQMRPTA